MRKGFTLIELLVVIAILAILATIVVLVLNPAELLRQARDSTRVSELAAIRSAISLWLATVSSAAFGGTPGTHYCTATCTGPQAASSVEVSTTIAGTGWVKADLRSVPGGSPLTLYPLDPINGGTSTHYSFQSSGTLFELTAQMESTRYAAGGSDDVEGSDGGTDLNCFEVGTDLNVLPTTNC